MDGEVDPLKIYIENSTGTDSIEILLNYQEFKRMVDHLNEFENEVGQFKAKNKDAENLGFTHLHLQDCGLIEKNSNSDIVFYINLNE